MAAISSRSFTSKMAYPDADSNKMSPSRLTRRHREPRRWTRVVNQNTARTGLRNRILNKYTPNSRSLYHKPVPFETINFLKGFTCTYTNKEGALAYACSSGRVVAVARRSVLALHASFMLGWRVDHWIQPQCGISRWNGKCARGGKRSRTPTRWRGVGLVWGGSSYLSTGRHHRRKGCRL
jgi:hypothetical protein